MLEADADFPDSSDDDMEDDDIEDPDFEVEVRISAEPAEVSSDDGECDEHVEPSIADLEPGPSTSEASDSRKFVPKWRKKVCDLPNNEFLEQVGPSN